MEQEILATQKLVKSYFRNNLCAKNGLTEKKKESLCGQVKAEEYLGRLVEYCHLKVICLLRVVETGSSNENEMKNKVTRETNC